VDSPPQSLTLDVAQAAELCKCSQKLLSALARAGAVPATKVGRRWVFPARLLQEWIDDRSLANVVGNPRRSGLGRVTVTQALTASGGVTRLDAQRAK
jgi:excisionase family DNA binding protein